MNVSNAMNTVGAMHDKMSNETESSGLQKHPPTIAEVLTEATVLRFDAEILLSHVLGVDRVVLHAWPQRSVSAAQADSYRSLLQRRANGEPVAYLIGRKSFWDFELEVTPAVLIPRPETEVLVEQALQRLQGRADEPLHIADLGTGSGAIALALAAHSPDWRLTAVDICPAALEVARRNAQGLGLDNIQFQQMEWCENLPAAGFDLIVSNPPYVAADDEHLKAADLRYEPRRALVAADDGLAELKAVITGAARCLKPGAWLLLEHGMTQAEAVADLLHRHGYQTVTTHTDIAGLNRVTGGQAK